MGVSFYLHYYVIRRSITFTNGNFSENFPGNKVFKIINSQVLSCSFYRSAARWFLTAVTSGVGVDGRGGTK